MSYQEVQRLFDPRGFSLNQLIRRHGVFERDKREEAQRRFEFGYLILEERWNIFRGLPTEVKATPQAINRFFLPFLDENSLQTLTQAIIQNPDRRTGDTLDPVLQKILSDRGDSYLFWVPRRFKVLSNLLKVAQTEEVRSFTEALTLVCSNKGKPSLAMLESSVDLFHSEDPEKPAVTLELPEDSDVVQMHIYRVSLDPKVQAARTLRAFRALRQQKPFGRYLEGTSWLIRPQLHGLLSRLSFTQESGVNFYYYKIPEDVGENYRSKNPRGITATALINVGDSPSNFRSFLTTGELPSVGTIEIPTAIFFN